MASRKKKQEPSALEVADLKPAPPAGVTVAYQTEPPKRRPGKVIHPRRRPPSVSKGAEVPDPSASPPVNLRPPRR